VATVALINPPVDRVQEVEYDRPAFPSEALAWLAPPLLARGHRVLLVDAKLEALSFDETVRRVAACTPAVVGITSYTHEIKRVARLAAALKAASPRTKTVVGGPHTTAIAEDTAREFEVFDVAFAGEGEDRFPELVDALCAGRSAGSVSGLAWREDSEVRHRPTDRPRTDLGAHEPDFTLLPRARHYFYSFARGCPYDCSFCANPNGRIIRGAPPERVISDLQKILDYAQPEQIRFGNENFLLPLNYSRIVMELVVSSGLSQHFVYEIQTAARSLDASDLDLLRRSGCFKVCFGLETGDEAQLKQLKKNRDLEHAKALVEKLRQRGFEVEINAILGHPGETLRSAKNTVDAMVMLNPTRPSLGLMTPYPGTAVAAMARENRGGYRLLSRDWDAYGKQCGNALELEGLSRRQMEWLQLSCVVRIFLENGRYAEFVRFCLDYRREAMMFLRTFLGRVMWRQRPAAS